MTLEAATAPTLDDLSWPRATERLALRRPTAADAPTLYAYRRRADVARWLREIQTSLEHYRVNDFAQRRATMIIVEHQGAVIGDTRIVITPSLGQFDAAIKRNAFEAELMWAFDPAWHGRGLATEAVRALVDVGFGELGLRRLTAVCYADNEPSWRLMERVGMRREGHRIAARAHRDGTWKDFLSYALLSEETRS